MLGNLSDILILNGKNSHNCLETQLLKKKRQARTLFHLSKKDVLAVIVMLRLSKTQKASFLKATLLVYHVLGWMNTKAETTDSLRQTFNLFFENNWLTLIYVIKATFPLGYAAKKQKEINLQQACQESVM